MTYEDDVVAFIDPNKVNRSINKFVVDEVLAPINQNEVSEKIKKIVGNNFQIWTF